MAHFYGSITGNRGGATRQGSAKSGMIAHIRGWDIGVTVRIFVDRETGKDAIEVLQTGGSHSPNSSKLLAEIMEEESSCCSK
jgi:hypothetical protein